MHKDRKENMLLREQAHPYNSLHNRVLTLRCTLFDIITEIQYSGLLVSAGFWWCVVYVVEHTFQELKLNCSTRAGTVKINYNRTFTSQWQHKHWKSGSKDAYSINRCSSCHCHILYTKVKHQTFSCFSTEISARSSSSCNIIGLVNAWSAKAFVVD